MMVTKVKEHLEYVCTVNSAQVTQHAGFRAETERAMVNSLSGGSLGWEKRRMIPLSKAETAHSRFGPYLQL